MGQQDEPFAKQFHVHHIVRFPTLQRSLGRLSVLYLVVLVPLLQLIDNLCMELNVLWKWLAQLHMVGVGRSCHPQVLPTVDVSVIVRPVTKQACFLCQRRHACSLARVSPVNVLAKSNATFISATDVS